MSFTLRRLASGNSLRLLKVNLLAPCCTCSERAIGSFVLANSNYIASTSTTLHNHSIRVVRWKSKKSDRKAQSHRQELEDEDDDEQQLDEFDELLGDKHSKLVKTSVASMRADLILRSGLGVARNKIETYFYESKIRVNGRKLLKKSIQLNVGDEVDIVKGISPSNPDHLIVARVEILAATPKTESITLNLRRHKSLIIENYENDAVIND
ncbi:mitochondrial transcription rescue factor 1 [Toxorhynchites rutilus septentrionalis]|uniref:mitochondrial transcription rescue factor 1 n=1 Tax=Toxorhynchites rutilus septentrionalis TaxID=329112 RepID=UPI002479BC3E|nr:mitochondrial transcription rescue factor 1 [Toxorhynchites rutilus septentrionalis]